MTAWVVYAICAEMGIDPHQPMLSAESDEFRRRLTTVCRLLSLL